MQKMNFKPEQQEYVDILQKEMDTFVSDIDKKVPGVAWDREKMVYVYHTDKNPKFTNAMLTLSGISKNNKAVSAVVAKVSVIVEGKKIRKSYDVTDASEKFIEAYMTNLVS